MSDKHASSAKQVSNHLNHQAGMYSLAAAVAGVSLLALAQPASGEVVITRTTILIPVSPADQLEPVKISMANNGINNFSFTLSSSNNSRVLLGGGVSSVDGLITGGTWDPYAMALTRGTKIGAAPKSSFFNHYRELVEFSATSHDVRYCKGFWGSNPKAQFGCGDTKNEYLGVAFQIKGQTHYGWIRLTVTSNAKLATPNLTGTITAYAYETVANKPIVAGTATQTAEVQSSEKPQTQQGPSLGMLAAGADAVPMWRRDETLAVK